MHKWWGSGLRKKSPGNMELVLEDLAAELQQIESSDGAR